MIYQNPYQNIRTADIYGARKQAGQDQLVAQENSLIMEQKKRAEEIARGKYATQALIGFRKLDPSQRAAAWNQYRMKVEQLLPEAKGSLPSVWDENDPVNIQQLDKAIEGLSEQFIPAEQYTLGEGQIRYSGRPGQAPTVVARGTPKEGKGLEIKTTVVGDTYIETPERPLPSGNILRGPFVYDQMGNAMPKEEYFNLYPSEKPKDLRPESQNKLNTIPQAVPMTPQAVPGQIELPPRQFNVPSPTNRAGETNQGYGIDENAMLQQPQIMPSMGNMMLKGAGAVMADEYAPQPRNALVGGMMQPPSLDGTMPPPSQFAELLPAGSAPNRFGSPGVEGMDFAYTGAAKPQIVNGRVVYTAPPKPTSKDEKPVFRALTSQEIIKEGQNPDLVTGRISQFGEIQWKDKKTPEQIKSESAQAQSAAAQAYESTGSAMKLRADKLTVLRGLKRYRTVLNKLGEQQFVDTGPIDQFVSKYTELGSKLDGLKEPVGEQLLAAFKVKGDPATEAELEKKKAQLPNTGRRLNQNFDNLNMIEEYILAQLGVQAMITNDNEWKALPPNTKYIDLRDGTPRIRRALPGEQVK